MMVAAQVVLVIMTRLSVRPEHSWSAREESKLSQCWCYLEEQEQRHTQSLQSAPHAEEGPMLLALIPGSVSYTTDPATQHRARMSLDSHCSAEDKDTPF